MLNQSYRTMITLGLPIILGQLGIIIVSFADNIMVGYHTTQELAAASFVNNLFGFAFIAGMGFSYGLTPIIAQCFAQEKMNKAGEILKHSIFLNTAIGFGMALAMMVVYNNLQWFDLPESIHPYIKPYFILQNINLVLSLTFGAYKQFFDGWGNTVTPMWVLLISNVLNIIGNWGLIFGNWGLPELGLTGAGISSLGARIFTLICFILIFTLHPRWKQIHEGYKKSSYSPKNLRRLFSLGAPVGLQLGVEAASYTIAVIYVAWLGDAPLAAHQILCVITSLGFMVYYGFGAATTILVSRDKANNDLHAARKTALTGLKLSWIIAGMVILLIVFARHSLGYIFTPDQVVVDMVAITLIPVIVYQVGDAMQIIYANALRGLEDVKYLAKVALVVHLIIAPTLSYIFGFILVKDSPKLQLMAIWCAFPVSLTLLGVVLYKRFKRMTRG